MANPEHIEKLRAGVKAWNTWRTENVDIKPDLSHFVLQEDKEIVESLTSEFDGEFYIHGLDLSHSNLIGLQLIGLRFAQTNFREANLSRAVLIDTLLYMCVFSAESYVLENSRDEIGRLDNEVVADVTKMACTLDATCAYGTIFRVSALSCCDLTTLRVSETTRFERAGVINSKISRDQLESLENYGGLSRKRLGQFEIVDDVALLRSLFSGFWNAIHLIAIIVFVGPYIYFVGNQWVRSEIGNIQGDCEECGTILGNLSRFITSGGRTWVEFQPDIFAIIIFVMAAALNIIRAIALYATKKLEHEREVTGFHKSYKLSNYFKKYILIFKYLGVISLVAMLANTLRFMLLPIPFN